MAKKKLPASAVGEATEPKLLSGGNPQIAKGDGPEVVEAYLSAMPGWKQAMGRELDRLVVQAVPDLRKAVRWNSPFYGLEGKGWFLSFHCLTKYIKVAFFQGASLDPLPPVGSKQEHVRYFHLFEGDTLDEAQWIDWLQQAAALPGETCF